MAALLSIANFLWWGWRIWNRESEVIFMKFAWISVWEHLSIEWGLRGRSANGRYAKKPWLSQWSAGTGCCYYMISTKQTVLDMPVNIPMLDSIWPWVTVLLLGTAMGMIVILSKSSNKSDSVAWLAAWDWVWLLWWGILHVALAAADAWLVDAFFMKKIWLLTTMAEGSTTQLFGLRS